MGEQGAGAEVACTLHSDFNLSNNFITRNAHNVYCQLNANAHALISFLWLRDSATAGKECFNDTAWDSNLKA